MAQQNLSFTITAKDLTRGTFNKLNQSLNLVRKSIFNMKVGLTAVAGAAGIGLLVKSSLQSIDTLGKTASKLGVTSQALQKLRYASELAGVETRTVDMAVQRFTRRLAEAAHNTGEAQGALKELGINARELAKQPLDKQMLVLADAFGKVENSSEKVRLAFKLFDSEGVAFLNTLQGGSEALQQMFNDADNLGFVLSSTAVKGVEDANDSMLKLGKLLGGVRDQVVAALAPALRVLVDLVRDKLVDAFKKAGGIREFAKKLAIGVIDLVENIAFAIEDFVNSSLRSVGKMQQIGAVFTSVFSKERADDMFEMGSQLRKTQNSIDITIFNKLRAAVHGVFQSNEDLNNSFKDGDLQSKTYGDKLRDLAEKARDLKANLEDAAVRGLRSMEDAMVDVFMGTKNLKDAFKDMARSIISDLIRIQIRKSIIGPLSGFLGGLFGGGKAIGGPVRGGTPYMVGERGPEMFVPNSSGTIVPNNKMGGGGVVVNQTINLSAGVSQTVRAEVAGMLPQIQEAAKSAVVEARRRGGSFASAFGA